MKCRDCKYFDEKHGKGGTPCTIENFHDLPSLRCLLLHQVWLLRGFEMERQDQNDDDNWWKK